MKILKLRENMYKPINIFLNQSPFYEDLTVQLFDIAKKKRSIYKRINSVSELKKLDEGFVDEISRLVREENKILHELLNANIDIAEDLGLISYEDEEDEEEF